MRKNSFTKIDKLACGKSSNRGSNNYRDTRDVYTKTKAQVYATGNKWAIENFEATHN